MRMPHRLLARRPAVALCRPALRRPYCSGPSYRVEPLIPIPSADVHAVARALSDGAADADAAAEWRWCGEGSPAAARYVDCRSEEEYAAGVVPGSINLPYPHTGGELVEAEDFLDGVEVEGFGRGDRIFVGCRKGPRSAMACEVLLNAGFTDVTNVAGGIQAWVAADLPVEPFTG